MRPLLSLLLLPLLAFAATDTPIQIPHGLVECAEEECLVLCDYSTVPIGSYHVSLGSVLAGEVACEPSAVLVAGGYNKGPSDHGEDIFLESAEVISLSLAECDGRLPELPFAGDGGGRRGMFGGWVDGMAVVCGGEDSQGALYDDCWSYNPAGPTQDAWTWLLEMQEKRAFAAAEVVTGGCMLVTGGKGGDGRVSDTMELVGSSCSSWTPDYSNTFTSPRHGHCLVDLRPYTPGQDAQDPLLITVGGSPDNYNTAQVLAGDWEEVASPVRSRFGHGCALVEVEGGKGVVVAGNDFSPPDLTEMVQLGNFTWSWTGDMRMERDGVKLVVTNGRATAIGGFGNNMFHPSVEYYHPGMDTWLIHEDSVLGEGRKDHVAFPVPETAFCR